MHEVCLLRAQENLLLPSLPAVCVFMSLINGQFNYSDADLHQLKSGSLKMHQLIGMLCDGHSHVSQMTICLIRTPTKPMMDHWPNHNLQEKENWILMSKRRDADPSFVNTQEVVLLVFRL